MSIKILALSTFSFVIVAVAGYAVFVLYGSWPIAMKNVGNVGVFGDSFGVLTSLFSGLAFAGIVVTVLLQREELQLQREELKDTREELRLTKEEMKVQNSTLKKQNFESTFFQMVRLHHEIVGPMKHTFHSAGSEPVEGRQCFVHIYHWLKQRHESRRNTISDENELLERIWGEHMDRFSNTLGLYFRNLYTIFKFIRESQVENKRLYSNIVRAQLSDDELLNLFYNCLSKFGSQKFKPLVEEFALFNNLPQDKLIKQEHKSLYDEKAFGVNVP